MNGKRAKTLRKLAGFVPAERRFYEGVGATKPGQTHVERKWQRGEIGPDGLPRVVEKIILYPLTLRNMRGTPRQTYQGLKP